MKVHKFIKERVEKIKEMRGVNDKEVERTQFKDFKDKFTYKSKKGLKKGLEITWKASVFSFKFILILLKFIVGFIRNVLVAVYGVIVVYDILLLLIMIASAYAYLAMNS